MVTDCLADSGLINFTQLQQFALFGSPRNLAFGVSIRRFLAG